MTPTESVKGLIRFLVFPFALAFTDGTIRAVVGSKKFKILAWLYGADEAEPVHDGWIYPE